MSFLETGGVEVKICGITTPEDARMCVSAGADAVGFNFFSGSSRYLDPESAIPWIRDLGDQADRVAVVVNPGDSLVEMLREAACFEVIQFHGDESPESCARAGFPRWIKALRVSSPSVLQESLSYETPNLLFDAWTAQAYGGTGMRLDWDMIRDFAGENPERRLILAGGLNVQNVRQAIRIVRPRAVDVASGVELNPRKKEEYLVREFLRAVKNHRSAPPVREN